MKIICLGLGSIGTRHARNVAALRPDAVLVFVDPLVVTRGFYVSPPHVRIARAEVVGQFIYTDWRAALAAHPDADCAIIASPTEAHLEQLFALYDVNGRGIPALVEKPIFTIGERESFDQATMIRTGSMQPDALAKWAERCAVGFQYRFHINPETVNFWRRKRDKLAFYARDELVDKYGPTCLEVMTAHPIDTALRTFGPAGIVNLHTDGVFVRGWIQHEGGKLSVYDVRMDKGPRVSTVRASAGDGRVCDIHDLPANDKMYVDEMGAFLTLVETGKRDPRLATLADGLAVQRILSDAAIMEASNA